MYRTRMLLLLAALAGTLLVVLCLHEGGGEREVGIEGTNPDELNPPESGEIYTSGSNAVRGEDQQAATLMEEDETEPWPEEGPVWTIVDERTDEPCPGALVALVAQPADPVAAWRLASGGVAPAGIVRRLGRRFRCDELGRVRLPSHIALVAAWSGDRYGLFHEFVWEDGNRLPIRSPDLRVRVVDEKGRLCSGVPIGAHRGVEIDWGPFAFAWSDREGFAAFHSGLFEEENNEFVTVAPGWPIGRKNFLVIPGRPLPAELPTLVLPPIGSIRVRVRDAQGDIPPGIEVALESPNEEEWNLYKPIWECPDAVWIVDRGGWRPRAPAPDGEVLFPRVGLGFRVRLVVFAEGLQEERIETWGPQEPGETKTIDIVLHQQPSLVARLVDEDGHPLAGLPFTATIWEDSQYFQQRGTTDAQGRIRYVDPRWPEDEEPRLYVKLLQLDADDYPTVKNGASWPVPRHVEPGELDLGTLIVPTRDVVVSGTVVNWDGTPAEHAFVSFSGVEEDSWPEWIGPFSAGIRTDLEGRFCLTGGFSLISLLVVTAKDEEEVQRCIEPIRFTRGTQELRIQLTRLGSLAGQVHLPESMKEHEIRAELLPGGGQAHIEYEGQEAFSLRWGAIDPGNYEFALWIGEHEGAFARIPGIVILSGQESHDPRINAIDLRDRLASVTVRAITPEGYAPFDLDAWRADLGSELTKLQDGRYSAAVVLDRAKPATIWLASPPHYRTVKVEDVREDRMVQLEPSMSINIEYAGLPTEGKLLAWPSQAEDNPWPKAGGSSGFSIANGESEILAWCPGPWEVRVEVDGISVPTRPRTFMVSDRPVQKVRLVFDREAYEKRKNKQDR